MSEDHHSHNSNQERINEESPRQGYTGENDRRRYNRRLAVDRRDMIRFEIEKEDRRKGKDRRGSVTDWGTDQPV